MKDKVRLWFLLLALLTALFLISLTYRFLREELMIDRCLSANHGSVDYSNMTCDVERNHPYVSYEARHPHDKRTAALALVSFVAFLSGYCYARTQQNRA